MGKKNRKKTETEIAAPAPATGSQSRKSSPSELKKTILAIAVFGVVVAGIVGGTYWMMRGRDATAADVPVKANGFLTITPQQAKSLIETRPELLLIDVRSPEEFAEGALPGSKLIPFWEFTKGVPDIPKDKPILLVCAVGGRSYGVGRLLAAKGYPEVYNLKGGLSAWIEERVPLPARR
jgi:rhodanese-related sulfurtransferase